MVLDILDILEAVKCLQNSTCAYLISVYSKLKLERLAQKFPVNREDTQKGNCAVLQV